MSKDFEKIKQFWDSDLWDEQKMRNAVAKGKITPEEFKIITGLDY